MKHRRAAFASPNPGDRDAAFFAPKTRKEATHHVFYFRQRPGL